MDYKNRTELIDLFASVGIQQAIGCEIGTCFASYSDEILSNPSIAKLFSIDPWVDLNGNLVPDMVKHARRKLSKYGYRSEIRVGWSVEEAKTFEDGSLDFVYIDGNHSYESTKADIEAWWPKLQAWGVLSGHDFKNKGNAQTRWQSVDGKSLGRCGVKAAVLEWVEKTGLELHLTGERCKSWFVVKA